MDSERFTNSSACLPFNILCCNINYHIYMAPSNPFLADPETLMPKVRMAYHVDHRKNSKYIVPGRRLLDFEIFMLTRGKGTIKTDKESIPAKPGFIYLIQPGQKHSFSFGPCFIYYIHFDLFRNPWQERSDRALYNNSLLIENYPGTIQKTLDFVFGRKIPEATETPDPAAAAGLFRKCGESFRERSGGLEAVMHLFQILGIILKDKSGNKDRSRENFREKADKYMRVNALRQITLSEAAEFSGLSLSRFSHLFKEEFGKSPHNYHRALRMKACKEMLRDSSMNISGIAQTAGYNSVYDFSRAFKKYSGKSPSAFRKEKR